MSHPLTVIRRLLAGLIVLATLAWTGSIRIEAADFLDWRAKTGKVDADITAMDLETLLQKISVATGWQIFLEPNTTRTVSTRFKERPIDKALDLLLGDLNRVLLPPRANQPARLLVFRTDQKEATRLVKAKEKKKAQPIPNELIVTLKPGQDIDELAKLLHAKVVGRLDKYNTYRLQFEDEKATELARQYLSMHEGVTNVDNNYPIPWESPLQASSGGLSPKLIPKAVAQNDQIVVALIDTMVNGEKSGIQDFLLPGISVIGGGQHPEGEPLHGDAMAQSILQGIASVQEGTDGTGVRILPVEFINGHSEGNAFDAAIAVNESLSFGPKVVVMSFGGAEYPAIFQEVLQYAHDQGVILVAAAGNEPVADPSMPAADRNVLAVTAGDANGNIAPYANYGDFVDVIAPGTAYIRYGDQIYRAEGTSVSTALFGGAIAGSIEASPGSPGGIASPLLDPKVFRPRNTNTAR